MPNEFTLVASLYDVTEPMVDEKNNIVIHPLDRMDLLSEKNSSLTLERHWSQPYDFLQTSLMNLPL